LAKGRIAEFSPLAVQIDAAYCYRCRT